MLRRNSPTKWISSLAILLVVSCMMAKATAQTEQVLDNFGSSTGGWWPFAPVTLDAAGNLYGTTSSGGDSAGIVFELTPAAGGAWNQTILYKFSGGADGGDPHGGVILDSFGNIYGTTTQGGAYSDGTVFELIHESDGTWTEQVLFNFNGSNGSDPTTLIFDAFGHLFGVTGAGGAFNLGTILELTQASGTWSEKILHAFNNNGVDGYSPAGGLVFDASGNLYSTTTAGGTFNDGTVFELTRQRGGHWGEKILHNFNNNGIDGYDPQAGLVFDSSGNLYGTTYSGGASSLGTVFELVPTTGGHWSEEIVHEFTGPDGSLPQAGLIVDARGNLYGTTYGGGANGRGTVFKLVAKPHSHWIENVLHSFGSGSDGWLPRAGVIFDQYGNLYGTTVFGGSYEQGTVFEVTP